MTDAYFAGLFDGEGSVIIQNPYGNNWNIRASMGMSNQEVILLLKEKYGGSVSENRHNLEKRGHKMIWQWTATGTMAETFFRTMRPHLIIKAAEVDLVFDYLATRPRKQDEIEALRATEYRDRLRAMRAGG